MHVLTGANRRPVASMAQTTRSSSPGSTAAITGRTNRPRLRTRGNDTTRSAHATATCAIAAPVSNLQCGANERSHRAMSGRMLSKLQESFGQQLVDKRQQVGLERVARRIEFMLH